MFTSPDYSGPSCKERNSLKRLLEQINTKLEKTAQLTWENITFGSGCTNFKQKADDLIVYRYIITHKINGCGCYKDVSIKYLISKIKQLTT